VSDLFEPIEKTVLADPLGHPLSHTATPPSGVIIECAKHAATQAAREAMKFKGESMLGGLEVLVTVRLQPAGITAEKCANCFHGEQFHKAANDGEQTDKWCEGTAHCTCEEFRKQEVEAAS
jgi:hypothetical protein